MFDKKIVICLLSVFCFLFSPTGYAQINNENAELANIQSLISKEKAPVELHKLVHKGLMLKDRNSVNKLHEIIDLIWSDYEGKILLSTILKNKIPIYIQRWVDTSNSYGLTVKDIYYTPKLLSVEITIKEDHLKNFNNINSTIGQDMQAIMVFVHEVCHSVDSIKLGMSEDSQEEELICSMVGMNIASRIIKNRPLTNEEATNLAKIFYKHNKEARQYASLPLDSGFAERIKKLGIDIPHYEVYSDLSNLEKIIQTSRVINVYKDNKENDTSASDPESSIISYAKSVQNKIKYGWHPPLISNSSEEKTRKAVVYFKIDRNGNLINIKILQTSGDKEFDNCAMKTVQNSSPFGPFPEDFQKDFVEISFSFNQNLIKNNK